MMRLLARYRFSPPLWAVVLTLAGSLICFKLGCWQLRRADEKLAMQAQYALEQKKIHLPEDIALVGQYQPIEASGEYLLAHDLLLDNRFFNHQVGYDVITPFRLKNGQLLLVDRGWVPAGKTRKQLPIIKPAMAETVVGRAYFPSKQFSVGKEKEQRGFPKVIAAFDREVLSRYFDAPLMPFILRLDKTAKEGFVRDWRIVSMPPARHWGYALQWFAFSVVMIGLLVGLNLRRIDDT